MLAEGHSFNELFGKDNPQTMELRFIEQIVGPVQSVYWGHIPKQDFNQYIAHLDFIITEDVLNFCLAEITTIVEAWELLPVGNQLMLDWKL